MVNIYHVTYPGLWMGGKMIVQARDESEAICIALQICSIFHKDYDKDKHSIKVTLIDNDAKVLYHDDGNY